MAKFSPTEAAFLGFGLVRRMPGAVAAWALGLIVIFMLKWGLLYTVAWQPYLQLQTMRAEPVRNSHAVFAALGALAPAYAIGILASLVIYAVVYGSILRTFLTAPVRKWGGLRFGGDEFRLLGAMLLLGLVYIGFYIAVVVLAIMAAIGLKWAAQHWHGYPTFVPVPFIVLGLGGLFLFVGVRLSLTFVATVAEKKIGVARSWRLTKGHFWSLFGAYFVAFTLITLGYLVGFAIFAAVLAVTASINPGSPAGLIGLVHLVSTPIAQMPRPVLAVWIAGHMLLLWLTAALTAAAVGPSVAAYKAFSAPPPSTAA